jgi:hypothetical protein
MQEATFVEEYVLSCYPLFICPINVVSRTLVFMGQLKTALR